MDTSRARTRLPLLAMNHVSRVCSDLDASYRFYSDVLGFMPVKRPSSFEFEGAWLFNYGVGLHLIKGSPQERPSKIEPKSCHISFQAHSLEEVEECLNQQGIHYVKNVFIEDGIQIGQLFFHDPDNNMIEICNCDELPVVPLTEAALACAARPPLSAVPSSVATAKAALTGGHADSVRPAHMPASSSISSGASDSGSDDVPIAAAAGSATTEVAARYNAATSDASFSCSSMSGLTRGTEGGSHAMSFMASELDEWPTMTSELSASSMGGSPPSPVQCKGPVLGAGEQEMVHV